MVTPKSAVKNEREIFVAECRVIIVFDGDIVFYKDNGTVMTNDNRTNITVKQDKDFRNVTMVIRNLTVNDSGTYKCGRRNVLTNDDATAVTLTVKGEGSCICIFECIFMVGRARSSTSLGKEDQANIKGVLES